MTQQKQLFSDDEGLLPISSEDIPPDREVVTTPYDAPVKSLMEDIANKDLIVNPDFQRRDVWNQVQKSRLIESLLLNIPIPVLYFAEDDDGTRVVVDGQQRLRAIYDYVTGKFKLKSLEVLANLNAKGWEDLTPRQSRMIENRTLRCVVISAKSDRNLRFEMFQRLNTGGVSLNEQELRNSLFRGKLNDLLEELAKNKQWLFLLRTSTPNPRFKHHELILRFLAMNENLEIYRPPLRIFLNNFMRAERNPSEEKLEIFRSNFLSAVDRVNSVFSNNAFRRYQLDKTGNLDFENQLNRAVYDVQMLSLLNVEERIIDDKKESIFELFKRLSIENETFTDALTQATSDKSRLYGRLRMWCLGLQKLNVNSPIISRLSE